MPTNIEELTTQTKARLDTLNKQGRLIRFGYLGDFSPAMRSILRSLGARDSDPPSVVSIYDGNFNPKAFLLEWNPIEPLQTRALDLAPFYKGDLLTVTIRHDRARVFHTALYDSANRLPIMFDKDNPSIELAKQVGESLINQSSHQKLALIGDLITFMTPQAPGSGHAV